MWLTTLWMARQISHDSSCFHGGCCLGLISVGFRISNHSFFFTDLSDMVVQTLVSARWLQHMSQAFLRISWNCCSKQVRPDGRTYLQRSPCVFSTSLKRRSFSLWHIFSVVGGGVATSMKGSISGLGAASCTFWCFRWTQQTLLNMGSPPPIWETGATFAVVSDWAHLSDTYRCTAWDVVSCETQCLPEQAANPTKKFPRPLRDAERVFGRRSWVCVSGDSYSRARFSSCRLWSRSLGRWWREPYTSVNILPFLSLRKQKMQKEAASVGKTPWIRLLRTHPEVVLHTVGQWRWGCTVAKPTGLLAFRLPFFNTSMYRRQNLDAKRPSEVAVGIGRNGNFRTNAHKEYPRFLRRIGRHAHR